jgi:hypothetical protein
MKKVYVFQTLIGAAIMLAMTAAMAQHVPIVDPATECPAACDMGNPDPLLCPGIPIPPDPGSDCFTTPGAPCVGTWPTGPMAGMPTWDLFIYGEYEDPTFTMTGVSESDPFHVILPTPGTYDFCAMSDQLVCALDPFAGFASEVAEFSYLLQCINMDINGEIDTCKDMPVMGNGMPDRYEFGILAAVLNDTGHPLHATAVAAMQTNLDALCEIIVTALSAVEISGAPMDLRLMSYALAPWLMPALGGIVGGAAAMDDPLTNAALDELLGLLEGLGVTVGDIDTICDGVPATGQSGDISGNGFTNREVYDWFIQINPAMTIAEYVALALDIATVVPAKVAIAGGGAASVGDDVTLTAGISNVATGYSAASYTWYKWEVTGQECQNPPTCDDMCDTYDWVVIPGETGSALVITAAQLADSGKYACDVEMDDGTKAVTGTIMASTALVVSDSPMNVPVGGALGLTLLAGACALAGAVGIRRRK